MTILNKSGETIVKGADQICSGLRKCQQWRNIMWYLNELKRMKNEVNATTATEKEDDYNYQAAYDKEVLENMYRKYVLNFEHV